VVDESRRLLSANRDISIYNESIINEDLTKAREFGVSFLFLSQETQSLSDVLRSLAFLKLAFPLNDARDLDFIKESFGLSDDQRDHLFKLPQHGVAVVRYGAYPDPFLLSVPKFELDHLVTDTELEERMGGWWAEIEKHVTRVGTGDESIGSITTEEPSPSMSAEALTLLYNLSNAPFKRVSDMTSFPGFSSPQKIGKVLSWLQKNGFIERKEYQLSRTGRKAVFAVLTDKAWKALNISGKGPAGKGSFEHSLYQDVIAEFYRARGVDAKIEGRVKGSKKPIDVLVKDPAEGLVAFEVTLHFENLPRNVIADFEAGVDRVVIVTRAGEGSRAAGILARYDEVNPYLERVSFMAIQDFHRLRGTDN